MSLTRFAADENFNNAILRGLQRRQLDIDMVRIQDTEMYQADDPNVLAWCTEQNRILLTHDIRTIPKYAYERIENSVLTTGVFVINDQLPIGDVIEDLVLAIEASDMYEWENHVVFFPIT